MYDSLTIAELKAIGSTDPTVRRLVIGLERRLSQLDSAYPIEPLLTSEEKRIAFSKKHGIL